MQRWLCWGIYSGNGRNITESTLSVCFYFLRNPFRTLAIRTRFFFRFYRKRWECVVDDMLQERVRGRDKNWRLKTEQKGKKHERRGREKSTSVLLLQHHGQRHLSTRCCTLRRFPRHVQGRFFFYYYSKTNKRPSDKRSNNIIPLVNSSVPALPTP